jgi:2-polyprenyl-6-methoxyphenol hydroxylase-like FAD-dependent oxidoreductase
MVAPAQDKALRADAATLLPPPFATLVATTAELFLQQVVDLSVPRMVFGRVVLIGDAAFVPRPHTAGSTMKAAYNGETLARRLATAGMELPTALSRWEAQQLRIGQQLHEQGQALAASSGLGRRCGVTGRAYE